MKVTVLTDNKVCRRGLLAEHGLSLFIEYNGVCILFDAGQSDVFHRNAEFMGIDLQRTDMIVLSHGHYDHGGGLIDFLMNQHKARIYIHPKAMKPRFKISGFQEEKMEIGIPWNLRDFPEIAARMIFEPQLPLPFPGVHLISDIPCINDFEKISDTFAVRDGDGFAPDDFSDEQMLVMESDRGLIIFLGCSHPGVISCLKRAQDQFPNTPVYALIAGMHMQDASAHRVEMTMKYLEDIGVSRLVPLHCTGSMTICAMKQKFKEKCMMATVGDRLIL